MLYGRSVDRPFKFRDGTKKLRKQRLQRRWPAIDVEVEAYNGDLPFEPVMVEHQLADLDQRWALLQQCNIDPTVHPFGGSRAASKPPSPAGRRSRTRGSTATPDDETTLRHRRRVPHVGLHPLRDDLPDAHCTRSR